MNRDARPITVKNTIGITTVAFSCWISLAFPDTPTKIGVLEVYTQESVLNPNLVIAQRYKGSCSMHSLSTPGRADAWRCQSNSITLDPCFQDGTTVACMSSPWSSKATILELETSLVQPSSRKVNPLQARPWGVELDNGQRCTFLTGASSVIDNKRVNYVCTSYRYSVIGEIDKNTPVWKAQVYDFHKKQLFQARINTAWF